MANSEAPKKNVRYFSESDRFALDAPFRAKEEVRTDEISPDHICAASELVRSTSKISSSRRVVTWEAIFNGYQRQHAKNSTQEHRERGTTRPKKAYVNE